MLSLRVILTFLCAHWSGLLTRLSVTSNSLYFADTLIISVTLKNLSPPISVVCYSSTALRTVGQGSPPCQVLLCLMLWSHGELPEEGMVDLQGLTYSRFTVFARSLALTSTGSVAAYLSCNCCLAPAVDYSALLSFPFLFLVFYFHWSQVSLSR